ncbi:MAG: hypothetical protein ABEK17_03795 [Candidatus Aenigmatarchaeota archaeon]
MTKPKDLVNLKCPDCGESENLEEEEAGLIICRNCDLVSSIDVFEKDSIYQMEPIEEEASMNWNWEEFQREKGRLLNRGR